MKPILQHLVELTGHRDHARLELSVIDALRQADAVQNVRVLEVFTVGGEQFVRPRAWIDGDELRTSEADASTDAARERLSDNPALLACIERREQSAELAADDGQYLLWLPVWLNDKVATCLEISQPTPLTPRRREVLQGIFNVYRNYINLLDYSERDALTGLFNRKTFDEQFAKQTSAALPGPADAETPNRRASDTGEVEAAPIEKRGQWLAVVDIDHFKQVNDRFGHLYGDEVLILVANILKSSFRSQDRVFRFGGEEFVVLLRLATLADATKAFNRFRTTIEEYDFPQVGRVTVSVGFMSIGQGGSPVEILGHADQALYYAKEHGRNQVCNYDDLVARGELRSEVTSNDDVELF